MTRIVYLAPAPASTSGGNKVSFRHVEALNSLGYSAVVGLLGRGDPPSWFEHTAPMERIGEAPSPDDILVFPEDADALMLRYAGLPNRKVVFCQNPYGAAALGLPNIPPEARAAYRHFMACSAGVAAWLARFFDYDLISTVPAFADERLFRPAPKRNLIAAMPRKRPGEFRAIQVMFERLHRGGDWAWEVIENVSEAEAAARLAPASVYLSLARLEGMSMTIVEAMACGCLVAGFTGIGPREYVTTLNGLWVDEDDCEAAARALVRAVDMAEANAGPAALMRHAARATAAQWTHAACVEALAHFWRDQMGVTP